MANLIDYCKNPKIEEIRQYVVDDYYKFEQSIFKRNVPDSDYLLNMYIENLIEGVGTYLETVETCDPFYLLENINSTCVAVKREVIRRAYWAGFIPKNICMNQRDSDIASKNYYTVCTYSHHYKVAVDLIDEISKVIEIDIKEWLDTHYFVIVDTLEKKHKILIMMTLIVKDLEELKLSEVYDRQQIYNILFKALTIGLSLS